MSRPDAERVRAGFARTDMRHLLWPCCVHTPARPQVSRATNARRDLSYKTILLVTQRDHRVRARSATCGNVACEKRRREEQDRAADYRQWIRWADFVKQARHQARERERRGESDQNPDGGQPEAAADHEPENIFFVRSEERRVGKECRS